MSSSAPDTPVRPGSCYRFVVESADQAAALIREKFGQGARVLSVRSVPAAGWRQVLGRTRLEVVVQTPDASPAAAADQPSAPVADREPAPAEEKPATFPPVRGRVSDLLRRTGFSDLFVARLGATPGWEDLDSRPLHQALVHVADELRRHAARRPAQPLPPRAAFFGSAGAGRTTALCKWLAAEVFRHGRTGRVVQVEFDRPNPAEHLAVICEAMGVPFDHYAPGVAPADADDFAYFDLPAISVRRPEDNAPLAAFLRSEKIAGRVLVLNAAYDPSALRDAYASGRELGATHVVFTHLDELPQWGKLWDFLLHGELEPLFFSTGPSLTGECEEEVHEALLRRTVPGVMPAAVPALPPASAALAS